MASPEARALAALLIEKGIISAAEFLEKVESERSEVPVWKVGDRVHHRELRMYGRIERIQGSQGLDHFVRWDNGARCNYDADELRAEPPAEEP